MRASLPTGRVALPALFDVRSSSGNGSYRVRAVPPDGVMCSDGCRGYRHHGHCRHASAVRAWLAAVIPPGSLPE